MVKALVVEDNENLLELLVDIFEKNNFKVLRAVDGIQALKLYSEKSSIDLVITDVIMPKMNGGELIQEIRKVNQEIKVIFMSGYAKNIINNELLDQNTKFVAKPFNYADLLKKAQKRPGYAWSGLVWPGWRRLP